MSEELIRWIGRANANHLAFALFVVGVILILSLLLRRRGYDNYNAYLNSSRWRALRSEALQRDGERCRLCNRPFSLEVHHRRYPKRWGTETVDDLTTLCHDCHTIVSRSEAQGRIYGR